MGDIDAQGKATAEIAEIAEKYFSRPVTSAL
jgi:hypothetical protein